MKKQVINIRIGVLPCPYCNGTDAAFHKAVEQWVSTPLYFILFKKYMETTTPNHSEAVITLPIFTQSEVKHLSVSLTQVLHHALSSDDAVNALGTDTLADYFYLLENTINAIPECTD